MTTEMSGHYQAVLADLAGRRETVVKELTELDAAIAAINRLARPAAVGATANRYVVPSVAPSVTQDEPTINYSRISIRWAVLAFMAEVAKGPMGSGAIAEALEARGLKKEANSPLLNLVSAVVSHLKTKGEMEPVGDGLYQLTDAGRTMWQMIKSGAKFREAQAGPIEPLLLGAQ